ncbi:MAG: hypothetical protein ACTSWQ_09270, partial [Candidatus Thorarchaeota archaeon]
MDEERTWDLSILMKDTSITGVTAATDSALSELTDTVDDLKKMANEIRVDQLLKFIQTYER